MSARKRASKFPFVPGPLAELAKFLVGPGRTPALALLMLALFGSAWYWGWQQVRSEVLASTAYTLSPEDIRLTNRPQWMSVDIREKVFHDACLDRQLSIMDPDLNERIAAAFSLHPWVAKVRSVSKSHPAGITVDLEYRRPVCMVYTFDQVIPVDVEGKVLPKGDLPLNEVLRYPRLVCGDMSTPRGTVGDPWGDLRVVGAAEIAAALGDRWQDYRLDRIVPVPESDARRPGDYIYRLYTGSGSIVVWGRAPGTTMLGEPTAEEKIAFLDRWMEVYGTLEGTNGRGQIDIVFHLRNRLTILPNDTPPL